MVTFAHITLKVLYNDNSTITGGLVEKGITREESQKGYDNVRPLLFTQDLSVNFNWGLFYYKSNGKTRFAVTPALNSQAQCLPVIIGR